MEVEPQSWKHGRLLRQITGALGCSANGLAAAFRNELAFRLEVAFAAVFIAIALVLKVGVLAKALMIASVLLVLVVELLNSALEATLDRISLERHPLAGRAKDMGSAAVFLTLVNAAAVWGLVLFG